jgi:hypothetical protein
VNSRFLVYIPSTVPLDFVDLSFSDAVIASNCGLFKERGSKSGIFLIDVVIGVSVLPFKKVGTAKPFYQ